MSAFLGISDAVVAALAAAPAIAAGQVLRGRAVRVQPEAAQAVRVSVVSSAADTATLAGDVLAWQTVVALELYARAAPGVDAEAAIDGLLVGVFGRLAATPPPAGVLSWDLDPVIRWQVDEADATVVQCSLVLRVRHFTTPGLAAAG